MSVLRTVRARVGKWLRDETLFAAAGLVVFAALGGLVGVRYALRNELELTLNGFYEAPATFTNPGTTVDSGTVPLTGTARATVSRWGALAGARWVQGLAFAPDGRIAMHRDYWDAAEELYEKLPVLGGLMRWIRRRAAS